MANIETTHTFRVVGSPLDQPVLVIKVWRRRDSIEGPDNYDWREFEGGILEFLEYILLVQKRSRTQLREPLVTHIIGMGRVNAVEVSYENSDGIYVRV